MRRVAPITSAPTSRSFLFDAIAEFDVSGTKAEEELFQRLMNGELKAWGNIKAGDMLSVIPRKLCASLRDYYVYWDTEPAPTPAPIPAHRIDPRATHARGHTRSLPLYLPGPTTKYRKVRFDKETVLTIWPPADASHIKSSSKGGRKHVWDWNAGRQYAFDLLDQKGDFDDPKQKSDWKLSSAP